MTETNEITAPTEGELRRLDAEIRVRRAGTERVVIVGQGYVGLPLAMRAVDCGFEVVGFDVDHDRIKLIASGSSPIEDVGDAQLQAALTSERFQPTTDVADCAGFDFAVISVPTPLRDGSPDLSHIEVASRSLARCLRPGACVILESTTYPGTTEELVAPILEDATGLIAGRDFHLGYSPERIDPGNPVWTLTNTPKVVSGVSPASLAAVQGFFDRLVDQTVPVSSAKTAEMTKLLENTFRHVNVALVNELAMYSHSLGVDVWEAIAAASTKSFGYMPFTPGPGVGGHCLPIDPSYLSWRVRRSLGETFRFVELANDINDHMPAYVTRRLVEGLNQRGQAVKDRRILLLGLAYKRNTGDIRESPALGVARRLQELGAEVVCADPHVDDRRFPDGVTPVDCTAPELRAAAAVVVLVDHDDFDVELVSRNATYVLDTRNCVPGPAVERL
jgi:UDP-N-acetyl-D-glucosamine dehydrogenase